jgi:hypothetical protein
VAAFESLAFRALTQAKSEAPGLSAARVTADGSLQGLGEFDPQVGIDKNQTGEDGVILLARLLNLLLIFLGETLTLRLVRDVWPETAFDDRNSKDGRNA